MRFDEYEYKQIADTFPMVDYRNEYLVDRDYTVENLKHEYPYVVLAYCEMRKNRDVWRSLCDRLEKELENVRAG